MRSNEIGNFILQLHADFIFISFIQGSSLLKQEVCVCSVLQSQKAVKAHVKKYILRWSVLVSATREYFRNGIIFIKVYAERSVVYI